MKSVAFKDTLPILEFFIDWHTSSNIADLLKEKFEADLFSNRVFVTDISFAIVKAEASVFRIFFNNRVCKLSWSTLNSEFDLPFPYVAAADATCSSVLQQKKLRRKWSVTSEKFSCRWRRSSKCFPAPIDYLLWCGFFLHSCGGNYFLEWRKISESYFKFFEDESPPDVEPLDGFWRQKNGISQKFFKAYCQLSVPHVTQIIPISHPTSSCSTDLLTFFMGGS